MYPQGKTSMSLEWSTANRGYSTQFLALIPCTYKHAQLVWFPVVVGIWIIWLASNVLGDVHPALETLKCLEIKLLKFQPLLEVKPIVHEQWSRSLSVLLSPLYLFGVLQMCKACDRVIGFGVFPMIAAQVPAVQERSQAGEIGSAIQPCHVKVKVRPFSPQLLT